ncbi:hypothetical protein ACMD2_04083 [Ananas comosus]|uniref:BRISC and BRCA1-A complex member 1 n=1 Tax=Ananas comosus TaxID=4615 RepID=A0A199W8F2_ANACO|nr:hypothetical protein ACMD2_04083 [Ananas comosus]
MEGGSVESSGATLAPAAEAAVAAAAAASHYSLPPSRFQSEDILFCVDVDAESRREMKLSGPKGRPITRLDAVKQALLLFVHSKVAINSDHRFALSALSQSVSWKLFTMDVIYLHDKPGPENCPQKVYDALVDALEHVSENEGYIFESGQGLARVLFRQICTLLAHPVQRCVQDDLDIPKSLTRKVPTDVTAGEESVPVSTV